MMLLRRMGLMSSFEETSIGTHEIGIRLIEQACHLI